MIVHIVMIAFKDENKEQNIKKAKELIDGLLGRVPSLRSMECGINFAEEERAMDLVLRATFDDKEGLNAYATDPEHLKVIEFIKSTALYSKVVDYEES